MAKRKPASRTKSKRKTDKRRKSTTAQSAAGGHDTKSRKKYDRGGRVEAYTFGEALGGKSWP